MMIANSTSSRSNLNWYPDSEATNHLTPDLNNVMTHVDYAGSKKINMGNVSCVLIQHVGRCSFVSQFHPKVLTLKQFLHVLVIT